MIKSNYRYVLGFIICLIFIIGGKYMWGVVGFIILFLLLYLKYLNFNHVNNPDLLKKFKIRTLFYLIIFLSFGGIIFFNNAPFNRFLVNSINYVLNGAFYKSENLGYMNENISNSINAIITMIMAIIALFLPSLFALYTSFKKEMYSSINDITQIKPTNHDAVTSEIKNYQLLTISLEKELKLLSQSLFFLLIIVMIGTFSINELKNLNIKGDLTQIFLTLTYLILLGYTYLLMFYYQTVIPIYKTLYKID